MTPTAPLPPHARSGTPTERQEMNIEGFNIRRRVFPQNWHEEAPEKVSLTGRSRDDNGFPSHNFRKRHEVRLPADDDEKNSSAWHLTNDSTKTISSNSVPNYGSHGQIAAHQPYSRAHHPSAQAASRIVSGSSFIPDTVDPLLTYSGGPHLGNIQMNNNLGKINQSSGNKDDILPDNEPETDKRGEGYQEEEEEEGEEEEGDDDDNEEDGDGEEEAAEAEAEEYVEIEPGIFTRSSLHNRKKRSSYSSRTQSRTNSRSHSDASALSDSANPPTTASQYATAPPPSNNLATGQTGQSHSRYRRNAAGLYICPQCPKALHTMASIRRHVRSFHQNMKPRCDTCGRTFADRRRRDGHQKNPKMGPCRADWERGRYPDHPRYPEWRAGRLPGPTGYVAPGSVLSPSVVPGPQPSLPAFEFSNSHSSAAQSGHHGDPFGPPPNIRQRQRSTRSAGYPNHPRQFGDPLPQSQLNGSFAHPPPRLQSSAHKTSENRERHDLEENPSTNIDRVAGYSGYNVAVSNQPNITSSSINDLPPNYGSYVQMTGTNNGGWSSRMPLPSMSSMSSDDQLSRPPLSQRVDQQQRRRAFDGSFDDSLYNDAGIPYRLDDAASFRPRKRQRISHEARGLGSDVSPFNDVNIKPLKRRNQQGVASHSNSGAADDEIFSNQSEIASPTSLNWNSGSAQHRDTSVAVLRDHEPQRGSTRPHNVSDGPENTPFSLMPLFASDRPRTDNMTAANGSLNMGFIPYNNNLGMAPRASTQEVITPNESGSTFSPPRFALIASHFAGQNASTIESSTRHAGNNGSDLPNTKTARDSVETAPCFNDYGSFQIVYGVRPDVQSLSAADRATLEKLLDECEDL